MRGEMIRDISNEQFLRGMIEGVRDELAGGATPLVEAYGSDPAAVPGALGLDEVLTLVDKTLAQVGGPATSSRGGHAARDRAEPFFPHDAVAALLQSIMEGYVDLERPELASEPTTGARSAQDLPVFTERTLVAGAAPSGSRLVGSFQPADVRWVAAALWHELRHLTGKHPFKDEPAAATIADRVRLVVVGDWGSGLPRARLVAQEMRRHLEEAEAEGVEAHAVHLGDVYYAGLPHEYQDRFLGDWPVRPGEADRFGSWCLNANHDMYSGGYGFFDHLLADARFARQAGSSWFTLSNAHWRIAGLDTAWDEDALHGGRSDCGLYGGQADLVNQLAAEAGDARLVLLSHHPLFTGDETDHYLRNKLGPALDSDRVHAWLWGHRHLAEVYEAREGVAFPVCLGHGGVPVYAAPWSGGDGGVVWRERGTRTEHLQHWAIFGFAVLDIDGPTLRARYFTELGDLSYEQDMT